jgi:glycosyltransferase involved in cell wall biosynthesis
MPPRFHVPGIPHTISTREYSACAVTPKIVRLCTMLKQRGHIVIHFGHEDSVVECDEQVDVTTSGDIDRSYGDHDWRRNSAPKFKREDYAYQRFYAATIPAIQQRKQKSDFLLCMFGIAHKPIADARPDRITVEPGIGYGVGYFAPFKVFESYALLHAYHCLRRVSSMNNKMWHDVVIPNYFDLNEFEYSDKKDDYFLFLGRVGPGEGIHITMQIVEAMGGCLIVAGPGKVDGLSARTSRPISEYVEHLGVAGVEQRKMLLSRAKGVITASTFIEPFCGAQIETMLSGTPVISTDRGAFTEYNLRGVTDYRCRTFEQFTWAAKNIERISSRNCKE